MGKRKIFELAIGLSLLLGVIFLVFNVVCKTTIRYSTPEESFQKSGPAGAEVLDVLKEKDVALIVYTHRNNINYDTVIIKDTFGWPAVTAEYAETKTVNVENGVVSYWNVQNKNVIKIVIVDTTGEYSFDLSDNCGTQALTGCLSFDDCNVYYGLLVIEGTLPNGYALLVGDETIMV